MNAAEYEELEGIREGQKRVHAIVHELDLRIHSLAGRLHAAQGQTPPLATPEVTPPAPSGKVHPSAPPPLPVAAPAAAAQAPIRPAQPTEKSSQLPVPELAKPSIAPRPTSAPEPIELRVGTFWMARIGIAILLTGLVFLGNYAYHRIVPMLGPWGKLALLAMAGGALTGLGAWLEKSRESLANYGRVLLAGGIATLYYTIYAAHYVAPLTVIENPFVGGTLLLAAAGGIMVLAERRKSETVALLAILLSYYTSAINSIGSFTLFSNLLLTAAGVFFLVRHGWKRLSFASLAATYGSYGFWRIHHVLEFGVTEPTLMGPACLAGYFALFTAAVFFVSPKLLRGAARVAFLTIDNGAFFVAAALHFAERRPGDFWAFCIALGSVLLVFSAVAMKREGTGTSMAGAYLAQGFIVATLGFVTKLTGPELGIVLAVESAVLLCCIRLQFPILSELLGIGCGLGAFAVTLGRVPAGSSEAIALGITVGSLLLIDAWWLKYLRGEWQTRGFTESALMFSGPALTLIAVTIWRETATPWQPAVLAGIAIAGLGATRLRMPEIALPAQLFAIGAAVVVCGRSLDAAPEIWWSPLPVVAACLILMHCWQRPQGDLPAQVSRALEFLFAGLTTTVALCWMQAFQRHDAWLVATSGFAVGSLVYGLATRSWTIALLGQSATVLALMEFVAQLANGHPHWAAAASPLVSITLSGVLLSSYGPTQWKTLPGSASLPQVARVYGVLTGLMFAAWGMEYIPGNCLLAFFTGIGLIQMVVATLRGGRERAQWGAAYAALGIVLFWSRFGSPVGALDLLVILALPLTVRWMGRFSVNSELPLQLRHTLAAASVLSLWTWTTRWLIQHGDGGQMTAAWAFLALVIFAAGLLLRDRAYRLGGFVVIAAALLRLLAVDVWRFDTLYRIVSFLVLGGVLLILSFVYSRFAETLRRWL